ncbi:putative gastrointestinal growth factor xP1 [Phyllobates terribilis]|uniref:putative gastrointestinal growth factor xP1 n=1 Tax=Phyllobates terribilis TaxID=111132 RepID=UPI003CCB48CF
MNYKVFCLFAIALIVGSSISVHGQDAPGEHECSVEPHSRKNCGQSGITREECIEKKCCYNSMTPNTAWCFHPLEHDDECEF